MALIPANAAACSGPTAKANHPAAAPDAARERQATALSSALSSAPPAPARSAARSADATPPTARKPNAIVRLWRQIVAVFSPRPYGDWSEAMTELKHLDSDTLRDVGAPPWLTNQIAIQREQDARALRMLHHR
ncbi:hypothetical protein RBI22_20965 [Alcaligenaceae bacterium C4P045]|nr:hypothetical protein [Alcaligenaceae bacterium C4P045]